MIGQIVRSAAGRDRGRLMVITGEEGGFPLVCDGKERPIQRPKRKNPKHLIYTNTCIEPVRFETNRSLRRVLRELSGKQEL